MRKLVSVKKITDIQPIEGADLIEVVEINNGWKCVSKKGEFQNGDLCAYFEIDSFLPLEPEFEFLKKSSFKKMGEKEGIRLKTVKLRGQISQGLALPLDKLSRFLGDTKIEEGMDITELLGVEKYEPPIPASLAGEVEGLFPSFIRKTDQERIQNLWSDISNDERLFNMTYEVTIKLDGSSMTVFRVDKEKYGAKTEIGVCSRNLQLRETKENTLWTVARKQGLIDFVDEFFRKTGRSIALQGELMGPGIQKNREKLNKHQFFLYNIFDIDKQRKLTKKEVEEIVHDNIQKVPFLEEIVLSDKFSSLEDILDYAEGKSLNANIREGVVFKSTELINGDEFSFKAISNKFLLKTGE